MLYHHITIVLAGTAAHFFTGWVLSSEYLMGKIWKHEKEKKDCHGISKDMRVTLAAQLLTSLAITIATCVAIAIFEKSQMSLAPKNALEKLAHLFFNKTYTTKSIMTSLHAVIFIWAGFIIPITIERVIWCCYNWKYWVLDMLGELVELVAIALVVSFLS